MPMIRKHNHHATLELVLEAKLGILLTVYYSTRAYESSSEPRVIADSRTIAVIAWNINIIMNSEINNIIYYCL